MDFIRNLKRLNSLMEHPETYNMFTSNSRMRYAIQWTNDNGTNGGLSTWMGDYVCFGNVKGKSINNFAFLCKTSSLFEYCSPYWNTDRTIRPKKYKKELVEKLCSAPEYAYMKEFLMMRGKKIGTINNEPLYVFNWTKPYTEFSWVKIQILMWAMRGISVLDTDQVKWLLKDEIDVDNVLYHILCAYSLYDFKNAPGRHKGKVCFNQHDSWLFGRQFNYREATNKLKNLLTSQTSTMNERGYPGFGINEYFIRVRSQKRNVEFFGETYKLDF